jgi:hypothetical protein
VRVSACIYTIDASKQATQRARPPSPAGMRTSKLIHTHTHTQTHRRARAHTHTNIKCRHARLKAHHVDQRPPQRGLIPNASEYKHNIYIYIYLPDLIIPSFPLPALLYIYPTIICICRLLPAIYILIHSYARARVCVCVGLLLPAAGPQHQPQGPDPLRRRRLLQ